MRKTRDKSKYFSSAMKYTGLGLELVVSTFVGGAIGYWLDGITGLSPWLMVTFLILGAASGFLTIFKAMQKMEREEKERRESE